MTFDGDVLRFERFNGDLAGGPFTVSGEVTISETDRAEPRFSTEGAQSMLVARNDTLTARADADVRVVGPLKNATVTGSVALTNSSLLKNIDLIPIGLPGRPAPQPPSHRPDFSIPEPPIRDWKFDVVVKTKDPFLIRGNLATGGAIVDMQLTGTGLRPQLKGMVRLENVEATLPFSRLEIASGLLYFDPSDSFNPKIDLHGTSLIRDYTVHVYVYGTALAPEALFTSEPPLPQEEIISLLATGTTRRGIDREQQRARRPRRHAAGPAALPEGFQEGRADQEQLGLRPFAGGCGQRRSADRAADGDRAVQGERTVYADGRSRGRGRFSRHGEVSDPIQVR